MTDDPRPRFEVLQGGRQGEGSSPFGTCPECGKSDGYRNIYRLQFFFCDEHRLVWCPGSNLLSSWREESEEDWRSAWELLKGYRTADGFGEYQPPGSRSGSKPRSRSSYRIANAGPPGWGPSWPRPFPWTEHHGAEHDAWRFEPAWRKCPAKMGCRGSSVG